MLEKNYLIEQFKHKQLHREMVNPPSLNMFKQTYRGALIWILALSRGFGPHGLSGFLHFGYSVIYTRPSPLRKLSSKKLIVIDSVINTFLLKLALQSRYRAVLERQDKLSFPLPSLW